MITTHYYTLRHSTRSKGKRRGRLPHLTASRRTIRSTVQPAPTAPAAPVPTAPVPTAGGQTQTTFVFQDGPALSPTEIATLRLLAAAGIRPLCVVEGSDRAPDAASFRAGLRRPAGE